MRALILAVLVLSTSPVSAQGLAREVLGPRMDFGPTLLYAAGRAADQWSTHRFLTNGSGCVERTRALGLRPGDGRLTAFNAAGVAAVAGAHYVFHQIGQRTGHPTFWRVMSYATGIAGGAVGIKAAVRNIRLCQGPA